MLQGSQAEEFNVLKAKQQLELQQAQEINTKQQAAIEELEKGIGQLKLEQQELVAKHSQGVQLYRYVCEAGNRLMRPDCLATKSAVMSRH